MKAVLISIQPKWCELIANGKKTIEVRKTKPKLETPFKVYIYCTKGETIYLPRDIFGKNALNGKVIGEFVCDWVKSSPSWRLKGNTGFCAKITEWEELLPKMACLSLEEIEKYAGSENRLVYGWHISNLVIYDKPKELSEFKKHNRTCYYDHLGLATPRCKDCKGCQVTRPPQSWCYVESEAVSNETR